MAVCSVAALSSRGKKAPDPVVQQGPLFVMVQKALAKVRSMPLPATASTLHIAAGLYAFGESYMLKNDNGQEVAPIRVLLGRFDDRSAGSDLLLYVYNGHLLLRSLDKDYGSDRKLTLLALCKAGVDSCEGFRFLVSGTSYDVMDILTGERWLASGNGIHGDVVASCIYGGTTTEHWVNCYGEDTTIDMLVAQLVHSLSNMKTGFEFSHLFPLALYAQKANGKHLRNVRRVLARYMSVARSRQQPDGSFGLRWARDMSKPMNWTQALSVTGRNLEWLALAADDADLRANGVAGSAARFAASTILSKPSEILEDAVSSSSSAREFLILCHAAHGMQLWLQHVSRDSGLTLEDEDPATGLGRIANGRNAEAFASRTTGSR